MNAPVAIPDKKASEHEIASHVRKVLESHLAGYVVETGKSILYKIEVDALEKVTHDSLDSPMRGRFAFQADILTTKASLHLIEQRRRGRLPHPF